MGRLKKKQTVNARLFLQHHFDMILEAAACFTASHLGKLCYCRLILVYTGDKCHRVIIIIVLVMGKIHGTSGIGQAIQYQKLGSIACVIKQILAGGFTLYWENYCPLILNSASNAQ